jgi:hypothetical protein
MYCEEYGGRSRSLYPRQQYHALPVRLGAADPGHTRCRRSGRLQRCAALRSQFRHQQLNTRDRSFWAANILAGPSALEWSPPDALAMSDDLPPPNTQRWVVRRKAAVIAAVRGGRITLEEALRRYNLTEEEYRSWERAFDEHGLPGLRSTQLQQYRGPRPLHRPRSRR